MKLFFRELGQGRPLIVLHGLFGMSDNWLSIGRQLANFCRVFLLDLRNHGQSPHSTQMNYSLMAEDVVEFLTDHQVEQPVILGHSMGGKVAMTLALNYQALISELIVVDIAPRAYTHSHFKRFLQSLLKLDLSRFKTRAEIDQALAQTIPQLAIRQFLLKNLKRTPQGFAWKLNLTAIYHNLENILSAVQSSHPFSKPTLFVRGEKSDYITTADHATILQLFPKAKIKTIAGATHWVHADAPQQLLNEVKDFLERL